MKTLKWILISFALAAVVFLTIPRESSLFDTCDHEYVSNACNVKHCTKCGDTVPNPWGHDFREKVNCTTLRCVKCDMTTSGSYHDLTAIPCTNQKICNDCRTIVYTASINHGKTHRVMHEDCSYHNICNYCKEVLSEGFAHHWSSSEKHQNAYCLSCGVAAPASQEHNLFYSLFMFIGICQDCGHISFHIPSFRYIAAFIGLLMSIAAFIYIFVNRKRISIQGGLFIRTVTPESYTRDRDIHIENL